MKIGPTFSWVGSKWNLAKWIIEQIDQIPHTTYVEPFGGSAAVLLSKKPSPVEVYNDLDSGLVNFFRVLRDPASLERLTYLAEHTPYSREEWRTCRDTWEAEQDDVLRAWRWWVVATMSFSGNFGSSWKHMTDHPIRRGMAMILSQTLSNLEQFDIVSQRLRLVQIEHNDYAKILKSYDTPKTLFYCDPPYVLGERTTKSVYRHDESGVEFHNILLDRLCALTGRVILSGYDSPEYARLKDYGWTSLSKDVAAFSQRKGTYLEGAPIQRRTEVLWISPEKSQP